MPHPLYFIIQGHKISPYVAERDVSDMDRATTIRQIAEGQFENLRSVLELDLEKNTARDVTREMAGEVMDRWASEGNEPLSHWRRDFLEMHVGMRAANSFARERHFNHVRGF
jgi:hypothetical protein